MERNVSASELPGTFILAKEVARVSAVHHRKRKPIRRFNLLDYIIDRKKQSIGIKKPPTTRSRNHSTLHSKRIKKRKKPVSRLRKKILVNRQLKIKLQEITIEDDDLVQRVATLNIGGQSSPIIHSRRFRSYCDNTTSPKLLELTEKLLREIFRFQARAYDKNQIKGRAHKRYVLGFKESLRQLLINKVKLMIIAPDCEPCSISGGVDDIINSIITKCIENKIPYLFSLERRKLGYILFKHTPVCCVGILNYDGAQNIYQELMDCLETEKDRYKEICK